MWVNGLVPRAEAKVSVLDSVVQGGDGVWEGLRVRDGRVLQLKEHIRRLRDSAHALAFADIPDETAIIDAVLKTFEANGMCDGVHARMTLSRGVKSTSGMDPRLNVNGSTLIILPEYKGMVYGDEGTRLITASTRRNSPATLDSKIHHNNLLNNILAKIEANAAGVDDAIMLDLRGFIAETNATNVFVVRSGVLMTPFPVACLPGLTRSMVLSVAARVGISAIEADLSLTDLYTADEAFTTGTMGGLSHMREVDGRLIGLSDDMGAITEKLQEAYQQMVWDEGYPLNFCRN